MHYSEWSLNKWQGMFNEIYEDRNRELTDGGLWLQVYEKAGKLAEDLRKQYIIPRNDGEGRLTGILVNIADVFAWFCAFTGRYGSLEEIIWNKFPNACPYCMEESGCICIREKHVMNKEERERMIELRRKNMEVRPKNLYECQQMLGRIYGKANKTQTIEQIGYHLFEEMGEVAEALSHKNKVKIRDELADVFAWVIGLTIKCGDVINEDYRLDDITWSRYPGRCAHCNSKPCLC